MSKQGLQSIGERGQHVPHASTQMRGRRQAVDLGEMRIAAAVDQVTVDERQSDRRPGVQRLEFCVAFGERGVAGGAGAGGFALGRVGESGVEGAHEQLRQDRVRLGESGRLGRLELEHAYGVPRRNTGTTTIERIPRDGTPRGPRAGPFHSRRRSAVAPQRCTGPKDSPSTTARAEMPGGDAAHGPIDQTVAFHELDCGALRPRRHRKRRLHHDREGHVGVALGVGHAPLRSRERGERRGVAPSLFRTWQPPRAPPLSPTVAIPIGTNAPGDHILTFG